jgi:hypothetical protein
MKKSMILLLCLILMASPAFALLDDLVDMTPEEIHRMTDLELGDKYADLMVERKASETFYGRAGFRPKDYENFKMLLKLILKFRAEMAARNIVPPPIEEWFRQ